MISLPQVIGLPPSSDVTEGLIQNSMPQMIIQPCDPKFQIGKTMFTLQTNWKKYKELLEYHEYTIPEGEALRVAFLADNFPTDSFTNTYSESFLNRFTDILSSGVFEFQQILGTRDISKVPGAALAALAQLGGPFEAIAETAAKVGKTAKEKLKDVYNTFVRTSGPVGAGVSGALKSIKGFTQGRLDFPMIWKNSGFTPSYTITVRLYNPNPSNIAARKRLITGPLAALLLLGLPHTIDGFTYQWPFFHKVEVPGLLQLHSAYIGNITVIKGGDQQQIAYNQSMGMVDVRIEFGSLFDTMVAGLKYDSTERPTLKNYLKTIEGAGKNVLKPLEESPQYEDPDLLRLRRITSNSSRQVQEYADMLAEAKPRVPEDEILIEAELMAGGQIGHQPEEQPPQPQVGGPAWGTLDTSEGFVRFWNGNRYSSLTPGSVYKDPQGNEWIGVLADGRTNYRSGIDDLMGFRLERFTEEMEFVYYPSGKRAYRVI